MNNYNYNMIPPFKWFVIQNFPFIEAEFDAMTNWQLFCKLGKEMNKIINSVNLSGEQVEKLTNSFNALQSYVTNYFDNLNVQEEVDSKLDEMASDGTLAELINEEIFQELNEKINLLDSGFFTNGIQVERKYNSDTNTHYIVTTIPKLYNNKVQNIKIGTAEDNITTYNKVEKPTDFAKRHNADVVTNAGLFNGDTNEQYGVIIQDGVVIKNTLATRPNTHYFCEMADGHFDSITGEATAQELLDAGVKNCVLAWYPILKNSDYTAFSINEGAYGNHPRTIIAQNENLDTIILSCNGRSHYDRGMDLHTIATILKDDYNCTFAFNMDGGGSTNLVLLQNQITYDTDNAFTSERKVPTFIYFKKETEDSELKNDLNEINKVQEVSNDIYLKSVMSHFLNSGNYKYFLSFLADCNANEIKTGFYYVDGNTANYPENYRTSLLFHYTWKGELDNTQNLRQIVLCASDNKPMLCREKYSTGDWTEWHPFQASYVNGVFTTAALPNTYLGIGQQVFNSTTNQPNFWNGTAWVDALNDFFKYCKGGNLFYTDAFEEKTFDAAMSANFPSIFAINNNTEIKTGAGFPTNAYGYGLLITLRSSIDLSKTQIYIPDGPATRGIYVRTRVGGTWLKLEGTSVAPIT